MGRLARDHVRAHHGLRDGAHARCVPGRGGGAEGGSAPRDRGRARGRGRAARLPDGGGAVGRARPRPVAGSAGPGAPARRAGAEMTGPALSVVVPAFNEQDRLPRTLERITSHLDRRGGAYEVLVVDDGSHDATAARAEAAGAVVLRNEGNRGK